MQNTSRPKFYVHDNFISLKTTIDYLVSILWIPLSAYNMLLIYIICFFSNVLTRNSENSVAHKHCVSAVIQNAIRNENTLHWHFLGSYCILLSRVHLTKNTRCCSWQFVSFLSIFTQINISNPSNNSYLGFRLLT